MAVRVATATETVASERATIVRGTSAATLMQRAGESAADLIAAHCGSRLTEGATVFAGPGNNGGDGWVVAESLARKGLEIRVMETAPPRTPEARAARASALEQDGVSAGGDSHASGLVIDAILGTGSSGKPRGEAAEAIARIAEMRAKGSTVISLDLPSGLDATTGDRAGSVIADMTVSFGTMKRGHLIGRENCGRIFVTDIGLDAESVAALPLLIDAQWIHSRIPAIPFAAHKGTRKRLTVVGGGPGMAGAAILCGEGALRSGIGLLRISTAAGNEVAIHAGIPAAIVDQWPADPVALERLIHNSDALAIGPGMGSSAMIRDLVERVLLAWSGPVVLDADALNVFAADLLSLSQLLRGRSAVITPHPAELARLVDAPTDDVLSGRFDIGLEVAAQLGATVLLKGAPTVVFSATGERYVIAAGTAALATGGSGDVLTGMIGTLLAQMSGPTKSTDGPEAAACAAFVHGRAAELCGAIRGVTLSDVLAAMPDAWNERPPVPPHGVLADLRLYS